jgi:hypothetical protein
MVDGGGNVTVVAVGRIVVTVKVAVVVVDPEGDEHILEPTAGDRVHCDCAGIPWSIATTVVFALPITAELYSVNHIALRLVSILRLVGFATDVWGGSWYS